VGSRVEIWDKAQWEDYIRRQQERSVEIAEAIVDVDL